MLALNVTTWTTSAPFVILVGVLGISLLLTDVIRREMGVDTGVIYRTSGVITTVVFIAVVGLRFFVLAG
jgi:hypothetical protein